MKFIPHFHNSQTAWRQRGIYVDTRAELLGEGESVSIPENPLAFSFLQLNQLAKLTPAQLSVGERKQLNAVLEYQIAQARNQDVFAIRLVTRLFRNPRLNSFLSDSQRSQVRVLISSEYQKTKQLTQLGAAQWKDDQFLKAVTLYRLMARNIAASTLSGTQEVKELKAQIEAFAQTKLKDGIDKLSLQDQLLLFEADRLVSPWNDDKLEPTLHELREQKRIIKQKIATGDALAADFGRWVFLLEDDESDISPDLAQFLQTQTQAQSLKRLAQRYEDKTGRHLSVDEYDFLASLAASATALEADSIQTDQARQVAEKKLKEAREAFQSVESKRHQELEKIKPLDLAQLKAKLPASHELQTKLQSNDALFTTPEAELNDGQTKEKKDLLSAVYEALLPTELKIEAVTPLRQAQEQAEAELQTLLGQSAEEKNYITNKAQTAQSLLQEYQKSLSERLRERAPLATDIEVLLDLPEAQLAEPQLKAYQAEMRKVRGAIEDTVSGLLDFDFQAPDLSAAQIKALDKTLDYESVISSVVQNPETQLAQQLGALQSSERRNVVEGVLLSIRASVLQTLNAPASQPAMIQFMDHYERKHHRLQSNRRVNALLQKTNELKNEQTADRSKYQQASLNLKELFRSGGEAAMTYKLQTLVRSEFRAAEILHDLESELTHAFLVAEYKSGNLDRVRRSFETILKPKVRDEYATDSVLNKEIEQLLTHFDERKIQAVAQAGLSQALEPVDTFNEKEPKNQQVSRAQVRHLEQLAHPIYLEVEEQNEALLVHIDHFKANLETERRDQTLSELKSFYLSHYQPYLSVAVKELEAELNYAFKPVPVRFTQQVAEIKQELEHLNKLMGEMFTHERSLSGYEDGFKAIQDQTVRLNRLFSVSDSDLKKVLELEQKVRLEKPDEVHRYVKDELGLLGPEGAERAEKRFNAQRDHNLKIFNRFKEQYQTNAKLLQKDINRMSEEAFLERHTFPKSEARKLLRTMQESIDGGDQVVRVFNGQDKQWYNNGAKSVFRDWLEDYKNPEQQGKALSFMDYFSQWEGVLNEEGVNEAGITELEKWEKDYKSSKPIIPFMYKKYRLKIKWYSIKSIIMTAKFAYQSWTKKYERRNDQMMAELGESIFGDTVIGREFKKEANDKEKERVDYWKASYGDFDVPKLQRVMMSIKDISRKDEARAAMELLIEKGELRIDSPIFLNMLNALAGGKVLDVKAEIAGYVENQDRLNQKVGQIFSDLWDRPTWIQTKESFESKYSAAMKNHEADLAAEAFSGAADDYLLRSLSDWEKGTPADDFERAKFEQYVKGALKDGLMNGYPGGGDRRFFYLIKGLTVRNPVTGDTILGAGALRRLSELVGQIPYLDALDDTSAWKKDGRIVPEGTPGAEKRHWSLSDVEAWAKYFSGVNLAELNGGNIKNESIGSVAALRVGVRRWLNECIVPSGDSTDRIGKIDVAKVDHDDMGNLPLLITSEKLKNYLNYNSGDVAQLTERGMGNLITSFKLNYNDTINYLKLLEREYKGTPGYQKFMEGQLKRFGEMMRTYFMMSHQMAGNWDFGGSVGSVVMSDNEWNSGGGEAYKMINEEVAKLAGNDPQVQALINKRRQIQKTSDLAKGSNMDSDHRAEVEAIKRLYEKEDSPFKNLNVLAQKAGIEWNGN